MFGEWSLLGNEDDALDLPDVKGRRKGRFFYSLYSIIDC